MPRRTVRETASAQAQRERILAAATLCFVRHGFHATSMSRIAQTAGISAALIYRYFDGKATIIDTVIGRQLERLRAEIAEVKACGWRIDPQAATGN